MRFIITSLFCLMVVTKAQADGLLLGFILDVSGELTPQQCLVNGRSTLESHRHQRLLHHHHEVMM